MLQETESKTLDWKNLDTQSMPTPGMTQYAEIKAVNPGFLLFYRMGDFFELFFEDAVLASEALDIVLTKRGKYNGNDIPMCGVPVRRADEYLHKLIAKGFKVAVCEQLETPEDARKRGAKSIVKRDVVRLVTPGTLTEDILLDTKSNHYLAALHKNKHSKHAEFSLSWLDVSTGEFYVECIDFHQVMTEISRLQPSEIIITHSLANTDQDLVKMIEMQVKSLTITEVDNSRFDSRNGMNRLKKYFSVESLLGFGQFLQEEYAVMGALLSYVVYTQVGKTPILYPPKQIINNSILYIDAATRQSLELTHTIDGQSKGSLLYAIDRSVTSMGGRMLLQWISSPLTNKMAIDERLLDVGFFVENQDICQKLREYLRHCPDIARAMSRLSLQRGGPRDLFCIAQSLVTLGAIVQLMKCNASLTQENFIQELPKNLLKTIKRMSFSQDHPLQMLGVELSQALAQNLPHSVKEGGFICPTYDEDLKHMIELRDGSRQIISRLEQRYSEQTDIKGLKIKHNNILGYFVEVREQYGKKLMSPPFVDTFIHRQTLANNMRFSSIELSELETQIEEAHQNIANKERDIFNDFVDRICGFSDVLGEIVQSIAYVDVVSSLAKLAKDNDYCCPKIVDEIHFDIEAGRHAVVEQMIDKGNGDHFIANDCAMTTREDNKGKKVWILTGPNMAGKSTFLRQNALFIVLAQMGSFVPAKRAVIGIADKLFSRVGASDNISRGESTFMVEMVETAAILNRATEKSFVILDEIGRGTATFDGMAIAWAVIEHIHNTVGTRAAIATHFHELTALKEQLADVCLASVRVMEWEGQLKFLHQVVEGAADRSYGIQVAKIAGVPQIVIARAQEVLQELEAQRSYHDVTGIQQLNLFDGKEKNAKKTKKSNKTLQKHEDQRPLEQDSLKAITVIEKLKHINPNTITPLEALTIIHECIEEIK